MRRTFSVGGLYFWLMVFLLYTPLFVLVVFSFNDATTLGFPLRGFTLESYRQVFSNPIMLDAMRNSALLSCLSSVVATLMGTMIAIAVMWYRFPGRTALAAVAGAPMVIPYVIIGVALLVAAIWVGVPLSLWTVGIGQVVINIPLAMLIVASSLIGFDRSLEEASMDLGATFFTTQVRITLPIIAPSLAAAFFTCLTVAFNEFAITFFLVGTQPVLPTYLYSQLRNITSGPMVMAAASVIILGSFVVVVIALLVQRIGQPGGRGRSRGKIESAETPTERPIVVRAKEY